MGFFDKLFGKKKETPVNTQSPPQARGGVEVDNTLKKEEIFSLEKSNEVLTFSLAKKNVRQITAEVKMVLDRSGSMDDLYYDGTVQRTLERMATVAFKMDDNGIMETMLFNNSIKEMPDITIKNLFSYSKNNLKNIAYGGTSYAPAIKELIKQAKNGEFTFPVFVIFITDGENDDREATRRALVEASNYEIYFQFVGIGTDCEFSFLKELDNLKGRKFDNAGFIEVKDLNKISDEQLYDELLNEFVDICKDGTLKTAKIEIMDLSKK